MELTKKRGIKHTLYRVFCGKKTKLLWLEIFALPRKHSFGKWLVGYGNDSEQEKIACNGIDISAVGRRHGAAFYIGSVLTYDG